LAWNGVHEAVARKNLSDIGLYKWPPVSYTLAGRHPHIYCGVVRVEGDPGKGFALATYWRDPIPHRVWQGNKIIDGVQASVSHDEQDLQEAKDRNIAHSDLPRATRELELAHRDVEAGLRTIESFPEVADCNAGPPDKLSWRNFPQRRLG
jgi:hypothetical protein